jgi:hypothetical protein
VALGKRKIRWSPEAGQKYTNSRAYPGITPIAAFWFAADESLIRQRRPDPIRL